MIYPNFLYFPDDDLELFIDTVQQVGHSAGSNSQEYTATDGSRQSVSSKMLPQATFECTWDTNHVDDIYRYLEYLRGEQVILGFGNLDLASYAEIQNFSMSRTVGTTQSVTLQVKFLGSVRGQFREAEANLYNSSSSVLDTNASGGYAAKATTYCTGAIYSLTANDIFLPAGDYTMFCRAKDSAQVTDDLWMYVYNFSDSLSIKNVRKTVTGSYAMYTTEFTITSAHSGKTIHFYVQKGETTANNLYIDFFGFVKNP